MGFNFLQKLRKTWSKPGTRKGAKRPTYYRPVLEALEERVTPVITHIWTGGSIFSNAWSDGANWQDGHVPGDFESVSFPADAKQRTNVNDLAEPLLIDMDIAGGDYNISGGLVDILHKLTSESGTNTISGAVFLHFLETPAVIDVQSGSLSGIDFLDAGSGPRRDLVKTGAGTLSVSGVVGDDLFNPVPTGDTFVIQSGVLSLEPRGQTIAVDLHVESGAVVRLKQGGDQISGSGSALFGSTLPSVTIDPGGVIDLNGHSEGLGFLTMNGAITTGAAGKLIIEADVTTNSSSTAVIAGNIDLGATSHTFNVADGAAPDDLFIDAVIQGSGGLIKAGAGRLSMFGTSANTYTGVTQVKAGALNLAKSDNVESIVGTLLIGDSISSAKTARVILAANDQISTNSEVRVNASGLLDLQGHTEILGGLILAGDVDSGSTGLLKLLGDVTTEGVARMPTISGRLSLAVFPVTPRVFTVADAVTGTDLTVDAVIVDGALIKAGAGTMLLIGSGRNTYTGSTTVREGTLALGKTGTFAINGSLTIGDGVGGADADKVVLLSSGQIAGAPAVTVNSSGLFDTGNFDATIGALTLGGGHVNSGTGLLTPTGGITAVTAPTVARISGRLDNHVQESISVAESVPGTDLLIDAAIVRGGIFKTGPGQLELTSPNNIYSDQTIINEGRVAVNGSITSQVVLEGGILLGNGTVHGIYDFTGAGGTVRPGNDGFGTLTDNSDFRPVTGDRFEPQISPLAPDNHDVVKVQGTVDLGGATLALQTQFLPSIPPPVPVLVDDSSASFTSTGFSSNGGVGVVGNTYHFTTAGNSTAQAAWTFQNLQPGSYRVSAAWGFGEPNRASNVPYTILDGAKTVTTVRVNQRVTAADFSKFGVGWDILGVVQVTGNSLTVQLTTNGADSGFVIADAILIEPRQVVIIDNDGTDLVQGNFANLPEGATASAVAVGVVNAQVVTQTQLYTISYKANDGNDVGLAYITTATAAQDLLIAPNVIHEGQQVTLTGRLTDPDVGDFLTLTIDWGDGKSETHHPGTEPFAFAHRYAGNPPGRPQGIDTVHLTWFDQHHAGNSRDLTITVQNGPPTAPRGADVQTFSDDRGGPVGTHYAGTHTPAIDHRSASDSRDLAVAAQNSAPSVFRLAEDVLQTDATPALAGFFTDPGLQDSGTAAVDNGDNTGLLSLKPNPARRFLLPHHPGRSETHRVTLTITDWAVLGGLTGSRAEGVRADLE